MSALDKFKRRLVRDIARRIYQDKQPEEDMWKQLKQEYGCDCHLLWEHMRALTLKKLKRLLAAEDRMDYITKIARMTSTDWLTFDLVLVHEKVDVIGEDLIRGGKSEPLVLTELFNLIQKFGIENLSPRNLVDAWFNLTIEYNTGGRQCSPMLLQRRWYQLKELTRTRVYSFWKSYRGNPKLLAKANEQHKPTTLQLSIAGRYQQIITEPFEQWENLIQMKQVVLANAFESKRKTQVYGTSVNENDPDLIVVEPHVETIELAADSDSDDQVQKSETIKVEQLQHVEEDLGVTIKCEHVDDVIEVEETRAINELENMQIPIETVNPKLECERVEQEDFESAIDATYADTIESTLPKITSVMGNVVIPPECHTEINETDEEDVKKITENCNTVADDEKGQQIITTVPVHENLNVSSESNETSDEKSEDTKTSITAEVVNNMDQLPMDLEFVDDGIELVDNEVEYASEGKPVKMEKGNEHIKADNKQEVFSSETVDENDASFKIDPKLIMFPISYTKKLDHMDIFKTNSFLHVKGNDIIECALTESKPSLKVSVKNEETCEKESDVALETCEVPRIKYTSWLLQKPKSRSYNPIQLCKNPDFNTRLKRLTVGFFTYERNRQLFSACKPVTIDLHKAFEAKLVDNTLHIENSDTPIIKREKESDACENSATVIPSAISVQSLLDNSKVNVKELFPMKEEKDVPVTPPNNSGIIERSKIIHLPDIEEIRRANQNLLTAEVSPIPFKNSFFSNNKPPVQLVKLANVDTLDTQTQNKSIPPNISHEDPSSLHLLKKKRYMMKRLPAPKIRTPNQVPSWSLCVAQDRTVEESLLTKDTLHKVLGLLIGGDITVPKPKKKKGDDAMKTTQENNIDAVEKTTQGITEEKNEDESVNVIDDIELEKSITILQTQETGVEKKGKPTKKIFVRSDRTITPQSGYCCWAQYKVQNFLPTGKKLRHLCPRPNCRCCCRNLLIYKMTRNKNMLVAPIEHLDVSEIYNNSENELRKPYSISSNDTLKQNIQDSTLVNEINTNCESSISANALSKVISIDTETDRVKSLTCSIQSPLSNIIPASFGALQSEALLPSICFSSESVGRTDHNSLTNDDNTKSALLLENTSLVQTQPITIHDVKHTEIKIGEIEHNAQMPFKTPKQTLKTKIISGPSLLKKQKVATGKKSNRKVLSSVVDSSIIKTLNLSSGAKIFHKNNESSNIETISLDEDGITHSIENLPASNDSNNMLPKGVNLLLLPDNTLSVSIDPGVQIDQAILSQLPEILTAVEKQLSTSGVIPILPGDVGSCSDINNTSQASAPNELQTVNQLNLVKENSENNLNNEYSSTVLENNNTENGNTKHNNVETDSSTVITKNTSKSQLMQDTVCSAPGNEDNSFTDNGGSKPDTNRKTILSDLMTMSGISPEDANAPVEEVTQLSFSMAIPSTSKAVTGCDILNNTENMLNTEANDGKIYQGKKPIKRIVISIRKREKRNVPNNTDSVIDLTDECDNSVNIGGIGKTQPVHLPKKYFIDVKHMNSNAVSDNAQPLKLFKTFRPSILKKNITRLVPLENVAKQIKLAVNKQYLQKSDKKQTLLKILHKGALVENSKKIGMKNFNEYKNRNESGKIISNKNCESDSDSSDDEPLAKKIKRIRDIDTVNDNNPSNDCQKVIPVEKYELPVEYLNESPHVTDNLGTDVDSDGEDNCILGV